MDEETRDAFKDLKEDNKTAHDEIKSSIKCLPCVVHADLISRHGAEIAVLKNSKGNQQSKLDWKVVGIFGAVITSLMVLLRDIIMK